MEAAYTKDLISLEMLNATKALCESIRYNYYETVKNVKVIVERADGTILTEQWKEEDIAIIADNYMAEQNRLAGGLLTEEFMKAIVEYITAQQAS